MARKHFVPVVVILFVSTLTWAQPTKNLASFNVPGILVPLYSGHLDKIADDWVTRDYVISIYKAFNDECPQYANSASAIASGDDMTILQYGLYYEMKNLRQGMRSALANDLDNAWKSLMNAPVGRAGGRAAAEKHLIKEGVEDGTNFVHNQCESTATRQLRQNIIKLANDRYDIPPDIPDDNRFKAQMNPNLRAPLGNAHLSNPMGQPLKKACSVAFVDPFTKAYAQNPKYARNPRPLEGWCRCLVKNMLEANIPQQDLEPLTIAKNFTQDSLRQLSQRYRQYKGQGRVSEGGCYE
jgi:hypothetical protein